MLRVVRRPAFVERRFDPTRSDGLSSAADDRDLCRESRGRPGRGADGGPGLEAFDKRVFAVTERWNTPAIVAVFRWITMFGNVQTLLAVVIVTTGFLLAGPRAFLLPSWIAILGSRSPPGAASSRSTGSGRNSCMQRHCVITVLPERPCGEFARRLRHDRLYVARDLGPTRALHIYYWTLAAVRVALVDHAA